MPVLIDLGSYESKVSSITRDDARMETFSQEADGMHGCGREEMGPQTPYNSNVWFLLTLTSV